MYACLPACLLVCAVPNDLVDGDAAGEFGIACVKSLLKIRGIKELKFRHDLYDVFKRLVDERTNGDSIEGVPGRFQIQWAGRQLSLKPLDA